MGFCFLFLPSSVSVSYFFVSLLIRLRLALLFCIPVGGFIADQSTNGMSIACAYLKGEMSGSSQAKKMIPCASMCASNFPGTKGHDCTVACQRVFSWKHTSKLTARTCRWDDPSQEMQCVAGLGLALSNGNIGRSWEIFRPLPMLRDESCEAWYAPLPSSLGFHLFFLFSPPFLLSPLYSLCYLPE